MILIHFYTTVDIVEPVKKFEGVKVRDTEKKSKTLVFHRFKSRVKLILYLVHGVHCNPIPLHIIMTSVSQKYHQLGHFVFFEIKTI